MITALHSSGTAMRAQLDNIAVTTNNIANINTTGYKRSRTEFSDILYQNLRTVGASSSDAGTTVPTGIQIGVGVRTAGVYRMHDQGSLTQTKSPFDLAIQGRGMFQITLPNGEIAYTRNGSFQRNQDGQIVNSDGYLLADIQAVPANATSVDINQSGEVIATIPGNPPQQQNLGQIQLSTFINEAGLEAIGDNLFRQTAASGDPQLGNPGTEHYGTIRQGFVEASNVDAVTEITRLIEAQRAYELGSKGIQTSDQMLGVLTNLK